ncbi:MAG TPA: GtrA family protein [Lichenihabitans sp.]|jgi:putative flippase GtrA|nr:GtrA family protein [Lichenihabitans sp.]
MSDVLAVSSARLPLAMRRPIVRVPEGAARFLVAGGLSSLVNWLVRFPLSAVMPFMGAVALAYAVGMAVGFALYRSWVFPGSTLPLGAQAVRFVAVNALGLATVLVAARLFVPVLGLGDLLSIAHAEALGHGLAIASGAVVNFIGHRAVTFARRRLAAPAT